MLSRYPPTEPHRVPCDHPGAHEIGDETRHRNGTPDPGVTLMLDSGSHINDYVQERRLVNEFLSILCFKTGVPMVGLSSAAGARRAIPALRQPRKLADLVYPSGPNLALDRPISDERRLALALYRDGVSSQSIHYQFLSFYKIVELRFAGKKESVRVWINNQIERDNLRCTGRIQELRAQGITDIGGYLRKQCRNAVVHVDRRPRIDPDDIEGSVRMRKDVPIIQELASIRIESRDLD